MADTEIYEATNNFGFGGFMIYI